MHWFPLSHSFSPSALLLQSSVSLVLNVSSCCLITIIFQADGTMSTSRFRLNISSFLFTILAAILSEPKLAVCPYPSWSYLSLSA